MNKEEFLKIKIESLEKVIEIMNSQYSDIVKRNSDLRNKLANATETIRQLNNKIDKMKDEIDGKTV